MRVRIVAAAAAVMGSVCPAFAEVQLSAHARETPAPQLVVSQATGASIEHAQIAVDIHGIRVVEQVGTERTHAVVALSLATASREIVEASMQLELPSDAHAIGLVANLTNQRLPGLPMSRDSAWRAYDQDVAVHHDPALLEVDHVTETTTVLQLRAYPISRAHPGTVYIELDLPTGTAVTAAPGVGVKPEVTTTRSSAAMRSARAVDDTLSLYAGPPQLVVRAEVEPHDMVADPHAGADHVELTLAAAQRVIGAHTRALRACFAADSAQGLVRIADIRFVVAKSGDVHDVEVVDIDTEALRSCVRDEVARWKFPATDDITHVKYPAAVLMQ